MWLTCLEAIQGTGRPASALANFFCSRFSSRRCALRARFSRAFAWRACARSLACGVLMITQRRFLTWRVLKAGFLLTGCEAKLWRPFLLMSQFLPQADLPKMAALLRLRLKVYGLAIAICPSGKIPSEEKKSWKEKGIKLLKRVWTAVALVGLVVAAGAQLFLFSHYFSYSVFASNLYHEANAANSAQPR